MFEFIPLAADHDAVAIPVRLRAGDHWRNQVRIETSDTFEQITNLLVFDPQLDRVTQVLVLATAAVAEISTDGFDPI